MCALLYLGEDTMGKIIALLLSEPGPVTEPLCASVSSVKLSWWNTATSQDWWDTCKAAGIKIKCVSHCSPSTVTLFLIPPAKLSATGLYTQACLFSCASLYCTSLMLLFLKNWKQVLHQQKDNELFYCSVLEPNLQGRTAVLFSLPEELFPPIHAFPLLAPI